MEENWFESITRFKFQSYLVLETEVKCYFPVAYLSIGDRGPCSKEVISIELEGKERRLKRFPTTSALQRGGKYSR
jgi:hypothetical protein